MNLDHAADQPLHSRHGLHSRPRSRPALSCQRQASNGAARQRQRPLEEARSASRFDLMCERQATVLHKADPIAYFGIPEDAKGIQVCGSAIALPVTVHRICGHFSFTISLWFSIERRSRDPATAPIGGTLLGAQSQKFGFNQQYYMCHRFIHIDREGSLYCSMINSSHIAAKKLEPDRWYHLVLTFNQPRDIRSRDGTQCVYLDGQLVDTRDGWRVDRWFDLNEWQLGSGHVRTPATWTSFRGLIDDFSVRRRVLSAEEIRRLAKNGEPRERLPNDKVAWSLQRDEATVNFFGEVRRVQCSRPQEPCVGGPLTGSKMEPGWDCPYLRYMAERSWNGTAQ